MANNSVILNSCQFPSNKFPEKQGKFSAKKSLEALGYCEYCLGLYAVVVHGKSRESQRYDAPIDPATADTATKILTDALNAYTTANQAREHYASYVRRHGGAMAGHDVLSRLAICKMQLEQYGVTLKRRIYATRQLSLLDEV